MHDSIPSFSRETRQHHPYRSLYAAMIFQALRDAFDEATTPDSTVNQDDAEAISQVHRDLSFGALTPAEKA